jgi:hypothetical protein
VHHRRLVGIGAVTGDHEAVVDRCSQCSAVAG